ncbi:hypothetical protein BBO99_00003326 [Phytophthora kernoviae]|uniref:Uncharacterized protein n=2 Tax=Phytophthora kernoviae TaxID=325452 RepID=A0A3R7IJB5_9STRA|nr:hypothetical protein G195_003641 [Phytophthora kernoviae 00238/432]KAG2528222.1 hypothetical protein JM16_002953 [Phytophthora kernoviae]KAG2529862.1 hypothetical protein JM18_002640 [Phytophthora kernoviae]RLN21476.1 hypothetical protein BBI17_003384 [Phytophthora kernoviae]RLN81857.1 hypothetical protein BBO99_00003326 [Phytophthora kernoviae]
MADEADWLPDLAALATLSVAVHYVLGLYGLAGAFLLFVLLEHGANVAKHLQPRDKRAGEWERTASALQDDTSTEGDEELRAPEEPQDPTDAEEEEEEQDEMQLQQQIARQRMARLVVRDVGSIAADREDMEMNSRTPIAFETELFVGHALFLVRTQPEDPHYAALFAGKRRMFWIQVQGRFKKTPQGPVYLGGELPSCIAPGVFTRSMALVIMGLIRRLVGRVSFSFGSSMDSENMDELPAVAFPLYQSVDQFVETPEGHMPPVLGTSDFGESEEQRKKRRHTPLGSERYSVGPTYTFDFHTMYVDLTRWETANLPGGLNAMDLASFFDSLPLQLVAYEVGPAGTETPVASDSHRQRDKGYLFSFEVKYDKHRRHHRSVYEEMSTEEAIREGSGSSGRAMGAVVSGLGLLGSELSTMSTTLSDVSSLTEEDPVLAQEHETFLRREHARRLGQLSFSYLCWMEEVDVASDVRRVHYVFAVKDKVGEYDEGGLEDLSNTYGRYRLAIVSSYDLRILLQGRYALKTGKVAEELTKLRFHSRSRIGSYSTISAEAQQIMMHLQSGMDGAFALQISTFGEEIVLCVGTASTRDAWLHGVLQYCNPKANFDRALHGEMCISFAASTALRPENRVVLNSRLLFPQLQQQEQPGSGDNEEARSETIPAGTIPGALKHVKRTLKRALHILNNAQQLSVTHVLAFLNDASAMRAVDLQLLQESGSHEEQVVFYLNLYHTVLAHAMIAHGFPRGKGQWAHFLTRMSYALSRGPEGKQVTLSLAEIEHVILRARLPRAELPHLSLNRVLLAANEPSSGLRGLGLAHPDFRLSLALVLNHSGSDEVMVYKPESVHDQLNAVLRLLLKRSSSQGHLQFQKDSNTIVLPRVCEWYHHDFGSVASGISAEQKPNASAIYCVRKLLGFMDETLQLQAINALGLDDAPLRTKYRPFKYTPKTTLREDLSCRPSSASVADSRDATIDSTIAQEGGGTTQL